MIARLTNRVAYAVAILALCATAWSVRAADDPLPSWNDGAGQAGDHRVRRSRHHEGGADFVPPADRIATFDQDGTLWVEHPLYAQAMFALDRIAELAPKHPEWKTKEPFKAVLDRRPRRDRQVHRGRLGRDHRRHPCRHDHRAVHQASPATGLPRPKHSKFKRPYTELIYQPMLEVMKYLRANGFRTYIVTGGGQEFVRVYSERVYGVPVEQVVGSSIATKYQSKDGKPVLMREPKVFFVDDGPGKAIGINLFIGKRPEAAFGNSGGDREMLEWTTAGAGKRLGMLVLHDDAEREYAYGPANGLPDTKVGTFSQALADEAKTKGWIVISMKNDWKTVFAKP